MPNKSVLVTGGAGYIGSHVVRQLDAAGESVIVLDNLSTGFEAAVTAGELIVGDTGDTALLDRIFGAHDIDTVMHFAALTVVPDSVTDPLRYFRNNTANSLVLLEACRRFDVRNFVFSSSAAVYGNPAKTLATEDTPTKPINPYGSSKLMTEMILEAFACAGGPQAISLRYFNVAGCDPEGVVGQSTPNATLLVKVACEAAVGKRDSVSIFGTDYPTHDGTGIRDYIHVVDLAAAHVDALRYLRAGGSSAALNCGYGHGYSVREVLNAVERVGGEPLKVVEEARRPGDPPELVAGAERIQQLLEWQPRFDDLDEIVKTSLAWERRVAARDPSVYWRE